ncbi:hypothetical protein JCM9279_006126 [Rhodotorula babjevae]
MASRPTTGSPSPSNTPSATPIPQIPPHQPANPALASSSPGAAHGAASPLYGSPTAASSPIPQPGQGGLSRTRSPAVNEPLPSNALPDSSPALQPQLTDEQKADVIRRHLLSAAEQHRVAQDQALASSSPAARSPGSAFPQMGTSPALRSNILDLNSGAGTTDSEDYPTPYHLEGGDVVAGVYKAVGALNPSAPSIRRSKSLASIGPGGGTTSRRVSTAGAAAADGAAAFRAGLAHDVGADALAASDEPFADDDNAELSTAEMLQPGGFRRDFVFRKVAARVGGGPEPGSDASSLQSYSGAPGAPGGGGGGNGNPNASGVSLASASGVSLVRPAAPRPTRSFIDFLSLYGHFGGENLEEIEEEDEEDEDEEDEEPVPSGLRRRGGAGADEEAAVSGRPGAGRRGMTGERAPLLRARSTLARGDSRKRLSVASAKEAGEAAPQGDASVTQAVLMLLKSFVGTGVLFLGKAFLNGGALFSTLVLCFIAMISLFSFLLLVETRQAVPGSFGDIGGKLYGKWMRWAILTAIVTSQIGFVAAYTIFVAQNLQAFFMAVTNCHTYISVPYLIMAQLVIFLPLALIRNIQKLSGTALVADAFILIGLIYIFGNEIKVLVDHGAADVVLFNGKDFPLLIGTAVFAFEGIGLVLPVYESMREPQKFTRVLSGVMVGSMVLFASGGLLAYLAYGSDIQTVVFINLPQDDKLVSASQFLYSIAILLSTPLQLFPAVRIMENGLFAPQKSGKKSVKVKWEKNSFRTLAVVGCSILAWAGAKDLDKFVSLIGSVACVPLGFVFPPLLHLKACAHTRKQKAVDIALLSFGVAAAVFSSSQTIQMFLSGSEPGGPTFGKCPPPS